MLTWTEKTVAVSELKPYERNPRKISKEAFARLKSSIQEMGYHQRCVAQPDGRLIGGHQRLRVFKELGIEQIQILIPSRELTEDEYRRMLIQDNLPFGEFDVGMLAADFTLPELEAWGIPADWMPQTSPLGSEQGAEAPTLADRFLIAPFSVLNAREGWWQDRKRQWLALGIKSELGRGGGTDDGGGASDGKGVKLLSEAAAPGGSARPACDYSKKQRGDGAGRPIA